MRATIIITADFPVDLDTALRQGAKATGHDDVELGWVVGITSSLERAQGVTLESVIVHESAQPG